MKLLRAALLCWAIALAALCALLMGCLTAPDTVEPQSPNEHFILQATHEIATEMGTWADPQITDHVYIVTCSDGSKCPAAGWVPNGGKSHTIYYWRPFVIEQSHDRLRAVARHEVEHVACQCNLGH